MNQEHKKEIHTKTIYSCTLTNTPTLYTPIQLYSDGSSLIGLTLKKQSFSLIAYPNATLEVCKVDDLPIFKETAAWLQAYFNKDTLPKPPAIKVKGTPFQELVWALLLKIPQGSLTTYGELSQQVALHLNKDRMSAQAIGNAVGSNPISILIPCHRVIGKTGRLTGYAGGVDLKIALLTLEGWSLKIYSHSLPNSIVLK